MLRNIKFLKSIENKNTWHFKNPSLFLISFFFCLLRDDDWNGRVSAGKKLYILMVSRALANFINCEFMKQFIAFHWYFA